MALGEVPVTQGADQQVVQRVNLLSKVPMMDGLLLENVSLNAGTNSIAHKLGRQIKGYQVWRQSAQSQIWDNESKNEDKMITLVCTSNVVVDLWVF